MQTFYHAIHDILLTCITTWLLLIKEWLYVIMTPVVSAPRSSFKLSLLHADGANSFTLLVSDISPEMLCTVQTYRWLRNKTRYLHFLKKWSFDHQSIAYVLYYHHTGYLSNLLKLDVIFLPGRSKKADSNTLGIRFSAAFLSKQIMLSAVPLSVGRTRYSSLWIASMHLTPPRNKDCYLHAYTLHLTYQPLWPFLTSLSHCLRPLSGYDSHREQMYSHVLPLETEKTSVYGATAYRCFSYKKTSRWTKQNYKGLPNKTRIKVNMDTQVSY